MIKDEEKDGAPGGNWRTYSRSVSWTERPPRTSTSSTSKPQWNSKARSCLPPLQPLSIIRPSVEEWPRAGSDDLGVWPNNPPTPGGKPRGSETPRESSNSDQPPTEFEFRKDKLAFFNKECSRILDHIYLGSDAIAKNREILRQNGITHVLNCVGFVCPEYFKNELVYKTLWLQDCPSEDITSILYDVFDYFEDVQEQRGRVLVHCFQGVSRSASLVIAYLMWKEGQSFDDAFQHVKAARGVTNPNVGFACQLLQCQKRVHALPASPTSLLRMYRMAPHSPYDPLHLVPKLLSEPGADKLDSRGAFIIQIPSALYVWTGKHCPAMMSDNARAATSQVIRYERAQGPVITIKEGEETFEFWDALTYRTSSTDGCEAKSEEVKSSSSGSHSMTELNHPGLDQRKLAEYDLDFEIFNGALAGGVVPPCPLSGAETETCLPARETGWNRFRRKFASGVVKELMTSSKLISCKFALPKCDGMLTMDMCKEADDFVSPANPSTSTSECDSPDSLSSYVARRPPCSKNNLAEVASPAPLSDYSLSRSPSFSLVESFSSFLVNKPKSSSSSPSLSPSTSNYASSFTFSPSSSNWSDLSHVSAQPSPSGLECSDFDPSKSPPEETVGPADDESTYLVDNATSPPEKEANSANLASRVDGSRPTCKETWPSHLGHRGSNIPPKMSLPSHYEASRNLNRHLENDIMRNADADYDRSFKCGVSFQMEGKDLLSDSNSYVAEDEVSSRLLDRETYDEVHLASDDIGNKVTGTDNLVFYEWPSMLKMDLHLGRLDSGSIYVIHKHKPAVHFGINNVDILYVWIGHNASSRGSYSQLIRNDGKYEDSNAIVELVDHNLLIQKGFSTDAQIKIVKEGEEPVELLEHMSRLSLNKDAEDGKE